MTYRTLLWRCPVLIALAAVVAASAAMNWSFALTQGGPLVPVPWGAVPALAMAAVAIDILKPLLLSHAAMHWQGRARLRAVAAVSAWLCAATLSLLAAIGAVSTGRDDTVGARASVERSVAQAEADLSRLQAELAALPAARPLVVVDGDITTAKADRRWTSSLACTNATVSASQTFCAEMARLQVERGIAVKRGALAADIQKTRQRLATTPAIVADPQAAVLSWLSGTSLPTVQMTVPLLIALTVEVVSSLAGFALGGGGSKPQTMATVAAVPAKQPEPKRRKKPEPKPTALPKPAAITPLLLGKLPDGRTKEGRRFKQRMKRAANDAAPFPPAA